MLETVETYDTPTHLSLDRFRHETEVYSLATRGNTTLSSAVATGD